MGRTGDGGTGGLSDRRGGICVGNFSKEIAPNLPVGREEGSVKTLEWIKGLG